MIPSPDDKWAEIEKCDDMLARYRAGLHKAPDDETIYPTRDEVIAEHAKIWGTDLAVRLVDGKKAR